MKAHAEHYPPAELYRDYIAFSLLTEDKFAASCERSRKNKSISISLILDIDEWDEILFRKSLNSISEQSNHDWELILSSKPEYLPDVERILADFNNLHPSQIHNSIITSADHSARIETCITIVTKEFTGFLDQGDILELNLLEKISSFISNESNTDIIYTDHDQISKFGIRHSPEFKPDWSQELLLSHNYIKNSIFFRSAFLKSCLNTSQPDICCDLAYHMILCASEKTGHIAHLSEILYHKNEEGKKSSASAGLNSINSALRRRNLPYRAGIAPFAQRKILPFFKINRRADHLPPVTILIPTKDQLDLLGRCITSLNETDYPSFKIIIIDNGSTDPNTIKYFQTCPAEIVRIETESFNYAHLHNNAVKNIETEMMLFLNNDTEVIDPRWLIEMMNVMLLDNSIGAVGAKLLYPNNTVQHAGVVIGNEFGPKHVHRKIPSDAMGYAYSNQTIRNYSAVTAACMLTRKSCFNEVGGFDEHTFPVTYNDVDYCLKLHERGYRIVFTPHALFMHHEAASRKPGSDSPQDIEKLKNRWMTLEFKDPYHNIAFRKAPFQLSPAQ